MLFHPEGGAKQHPIICCDIPESVGLAWAEVHPRLGGREDHGWCVDVADCLLGLKGALAKLETERPCIRASRPGPFHLCPPFFPTKIAHTFLFWSSILKRKDNPSEAQKELSRQNLVLPHPSPPGKGQSEEKLYKSVGGNAILWTSGRFLGAPNWRFFKVTQFWLTAR